MSGGDLYTFSYKHPKYRKLHYLKIFAETANEAERQAPKEIVRNDRACLLYGCHGKLD